MDDLYACSLFFLVLFHTKANGYTFRENNNVYFALSNSEMSIEELKQRENKLFLENGETLTVLCQLIDKQNWSLARSEELTKKYIFSGLYPYITFRNKTRWKTYKFQTKEATSVFRWRIEIPRNVFTPGINDVLFDPWFVTVELGNGLGLYETKGILVPKKQLVNLTQALGKMVAQSSVMIGLKAEFLIKPAPCCGDILFVLPFKNQSASNVGGCYVGVTYGAFVPETTLWLDVCSNQNDNASLCSVFPSDDCSGLRILDIVITRKFIVLATSFGLVRSASFALLLSGQSVPKVYSRVLSPANLTSSFASGDVELQYTSYCLDFHVFSEMKDFVYLLSTDSVKTLYRSQSPYTILSEFTLNTPFPVVEVLGIVNDVTKYSQVLLLKSLVDQVERYVVLAASQDSNSHLVFPPWYFSKNTIATNILFHTWSNTIFVYGSEVWKSRDGGNSFEQLTELRSPRIITTLTFPQYRDKIMVLTNHGKILTGRIGISRVVAIHHHVLSEPFESILVDELETLKVFYQTGSPSLFGTYSIAKVNFESYQKHVCTDHLLLQFIDNQEVFIFAAAPYEQVSNQPLTSYCFSSSVVKQVLKCRSGGSAHISEVLRLNSSTGFFARAKGLVIEDFVGLAAGFAPILSMDLQVRILKTAFYDVVYELSVTGKGWSNIHVGRTVVFDNGISILLVKFVDNSTMYGLSPPGISPNILPHTYQKSGTWQIYDLSSATVINATEDNVRISFVLEKFKATSSFLFSNSHIEKVLMIHNDNHGVIESVSGQVVFFENASLLKEGNFTD